MPWISELDVPFPCAHKSAENSGAIIKSGVIDPSLLGHLFDILLRHTHLLGDALEAVPLPEKVLDDAPLGRFIVHLCISRRLCLCVRLEGLLLIGRWSLGGGVLEYKFEDGLDLVQAVHGIVEHDGAAIWKLEDDQADAVL